MMQSCVIYHRRALRPAKPKLVYGKLSHAVSDAFGHARRITVYDVGARLCRTIFTWVPITAERNNLLFST
jgi:hypothetical protein